MRDCVPLSVEYDNGQHKRRTCEKGREEREREMLPLATYGHYLRVCAYTST